MTDADDHVYVGPPEEPNRYRLFREAAPPGGEGQVWHAFTRTQGVDTAVAVKDLGGEDADLKVRLAAEQVHLLQAIEHPGIIRAREAFKGAAPHRSDNPTKAPPHAYMVMAWAEGQDLRHWALGNPTRTWSDVSRFVSEIASALAHLHSGEDTGGQPVLHRDLKPSNVMVRSSGKMQLVDFGLATGAYRRQRGGHTVGYVAPELDPECGGHGPASKATDLFAFAGIVYFLAVGEDPPADHSLAVIRAKLSSAQILARQGPLIDHIMTGFAPADSRPSDVTDWARAFNSVSTNPGTGSTGPLPIVGPFDERTVPYPAATGASPPARPSRTRRRVWLAVAAGALALALAGVLLSQVGRGTDEPRGKGSNPATPSPTQAVSATGTPATTKATIATVPPTPAPSPTTVAAPVSTVQKVSALNAVDYGGSNTAGIYRKATASANGVTYIDPLVGSAGCQSEATSWVDYDLGRKWNTLTGVVAIADDSSAQSKASFTIYVDGNAVASGPLSLGTSVPINSTVTNGLRLRIEMVDPNAPSQRCGFEQIETSVVFGNLELRT